MGKSKSNGKAARFAGTIPAGFSPVAGGSRRTLAEGENLTGKFTGAVEVASAKFKGKKQWVYAITTDDGVCEELYGAPTLDRRMAAVKTGARIYVERGPDAKPRPPYKNGLKLYVVAVAGPTKTKRV